MSYRLSLLLGLGLSLSAYFSSLTQTIAQQFDFIPRISEHQKQTPAHIDELVKIVQKGDLAQAVIMASAPADPLGLMSFGKKPGSTESQQKGSLNSPINRSIAYVAAAALSAQAATLPGEITFGFFGEAPLDEIRVEVAFAKAVVVGQSLRLIVSEADLALVQKVAGKIKQVRPETNFEFITYKTNEVFYKNLLKSNRRLTRTDLSEQFGLSLATTYLVHSGIHLVDESNNSIDFDTFLPPLEKLLQDDRIIHILRAIQSAA